MKIPKVIDRRKSKRFFSLNLNPNPISFIFPFEENKQKIIIDNIKEFIASVKYKFIILFVALIAILRKRKRNFIQFLKSKFFGSKTNFFPQFVISPMPIITMSHEIHGKLWDKTSLQFQKFKVGRG